MKKRIKLILDLAMTAAMLFLMARQVTGEKAHEWIGIGLFAVIIAHNILNIKWYGALFKGKYSFTRIIITAVNIPLSAAMLATMASGIMMNNFVLPLRIEGTMAAARILHLACSYWSFVLMSVHLGLHWSMVLSVFPKKSGKSRAKTAVTVIVRIIAAAFAVYGGYCFVKADIFTYMTFKAHFAFLDYERAPILVLCDNIAMMCAWAFLSYYILKLVHFNSRSQKTEKGEGEKQQ